MFEQPTTVQFDLPDWLGEYSKSYSISKDLNSRMSFVIAASLKNVAMGTGGPFAAGIFEIDSGQLVALGVNLVTSQNLSILHGEMVAITLAQRKLGTYDLGNDALPDMELISSAEPCSMCLGAIPWSGVKHVAAAAREIDIRSMGFDEGPKPDDWIGSLQQRGIRVSSDIERDQACEVFRRTQSEFHFTKY